MDLDLHESLDWRYETKFVLIADDESRFLEWIASTPDFYKVHDSRRVNTVYLDSADYDCAMANLGGFGWRSKFRLRWYGDEPTPEKTRFEIKLKRGRVGAKQMCHVDIDGADPLSLPQSALDKIFRQTTLSDQVMTPVAHIKPVLFVGYERDYFQGANGIRITVDRGLTFRNLTDEQGVGPQESHQDSRLVLEFKFAPDQKDHAAEIMSGLPFSATRSSKYILGLSHVGKTVYF